MVMGGVRDGGERGGHGVEETRRRARVLEGPLKVSKRLLPIAHPSREWIQASLVSEVRLRLLLWRRRRLL